ncbi:hypothetical protein GQ43DRAFT_310365 [Delitschia confertaspora ATCC 74209]|uniref:YDG domain-containing protein n=1 Tax=Delitschia confertaspora ATCC 74209 TaxID=1513339 RepID=A0A9P4JNT2_9PLEO|nr:hypothetical protein GQ43DRAFT_310365 [Delitschia confertaspora ATCC 74209]
MASTEDTLPTTVTRARLRELASWIRDELDLTVAREGPDIMHADDVLLLHDLFETLLTSPIITVNTLRATGIHRAVMFVCGKATRWPSKLIDQCDLIVEAWTEKFGPLKSIRPFLYGRGGRLEGIARPSDKSRTALLKRWQYTCPERIAPSVSRRHGDLGFKPGDWWISPLFAYHAGIIDLKTTDGGICCDDQKAYALLLKASEDEIMTSTPKEFTYRCPRNDPGRFRLTAADPKSRHLIRVLRSHTLTNLWAPKVGVRYEGLFKVAGWSVRLVPRHQIAEKWKRENHEREDDLKLADLVIDIKFEAIEQIDPEALLKRPLAAEIDDYVEYQRLKSASKEEKDTTTPVTVAPVIQPVTGFLGKNLWLPLEKGSHSPTHGSPHGSPGRAGRPSWSLQREPSAVSVVSKGSPSIRDEVAPWLNEEPQAPPVRAASIRLEQGYGTPRLSPRVTPQGSSPDSHPSVRSHLSFRAPSPTPGPRTVTSNFSIDSDLGSPKKSSKKSRLPKKFTSNTLDLNDETAEARSTRHSIKPVSRGLKSFTRLLDGHEEFSDFSDDDDLGLLDGTDDAKRETREGDSISPRISLDEPTDEDYFTQEPTGYSSHLGARSRQDSSKISPGTGGPLMDSPNRSPLGVISPLLLQRRNAIGYGFLPMKRGAEPVLSKGETDGEFERLLNAPYGTKGTPPPEDDPFMDSNQTDETGVWEERVVGGVRFKNPFKGKGTKGMTEESPRGKREKLQRSADKKA